MVALPAEYEQTEPSFTHIPSEQIPVWQQGDVTFRLIAGEVMGRKSPVPVYCPMYLVEIKTEKGGEISIGNELFGESGLYILEGGIREAGNFSGLNRF